MQFNVFDLLRGARTWYLNSSFETAIFLILWVIIGNSSMQHVQVFHHVHVCSVRGLIVNVAPIVKFALLDGVNIATKVHQLVFGVGVSVLDLVNMALECLSRFVFVKVNFERSQAINRHIWLSSEADRADFLSHLFLSDFCILCFD